jgi:hypothetical protein
MVWMRISHTKSNVDAQEWRGGGLITTDQNKTEMHERCGEMGEEKE